MTPLSSPLSGLMDQPEVALPSQKPSSSSNALAFDLITCFKALPSCKADGHLPPILHHPSEDDDSSCTFSDLGFELTAMILSKLDARDLSAASTTCKYFLALGAATVPDLNLETLYPHQRTALRWMMQKEQDGPPPPHPFISEWHMGPDRIPIYVNFTTGEILTDPPPDLACMKGGLFCE